jgi:hypothetical protein
MKLTTHLHIVLRSKNVWSYTSHSPIHLHGVVLSLKKKAQDNSTFYLHYYAFSLQNLHHALHLTTDDLLSVTYFIALFTKITFGLHELLKRLFKSRSAKKKKNIVSIRKYWIYISLILQVLFPSQSLLLTVWNS